MYNAYVTKLTNVRKHPNADRLNLAECFGNTVCVSLDSYEGEIGVYFPEGGQVSELFATRNDLLRRKDENGNQCGGYMDPDKRNVTAIRLRGERSEGLFLPISCLESFGDTSILNVGDIVNEFNGVEICCKYIPARQRRHGNDASGNRTRKKTVNIAPLFAEHADTEQLAYNLGAFRIGDKLELTLKMHGTSARTGYLPVFSEYYSENRGWNRIIKYFVNKSENNFGNFTKKIRKEAMNHAIPRYEWNYISGTRRTVLEDFGSGGYYGSNSFREPHANFFRDKLMKGETVYYEIVGYTDTGAPIMGSCSNTKLGKEFEKQYGKYTEFSYGCAADGKEKPTSAAYVYRMTLTNEDGYVVEYTPDVMRARCEYMGVNYVPVFAEATVMSIDETGTPLVGYFDNNAGEYVCESIIDWAEKYYDGPDPIGKTHVREGVVVRITSRPGFRAFKHKNFSFKVLSGIVVETAAESGALDDMSADQLEEM